MPREPDRDKITRRRNEVTNLLEDKEDECRNLRWQRAALDLALEALDEDSGTKSTTNCQNSEDAAK